MEELAAAFLPTLKFYYGISTHMHRQTFERKAGDEIGRHFHREHKADIHSSKVAEKFFMNN